ncbi:16S rRNA (uracil(1498)-N(3))-methyltransferase [Lentilactobacillus sp. SPB1-3]|uniref:16S rRNA (Uracil(1498)-N(3))-methyltransferase n=1 Tax=Lentilactobacillus terminaliae TaxID=3003483 RepID=A0ACD5DC62_9LACO|nr:16S rRNA (uracil(1498)-N(3))-methyltransferase [Lentilactobacillus sp. SPB1-3]MCZ0977293.1 16S rRNA (uracil(1498)-N(3))-methyltransferase [Lentilactobacillus sp. SPB1-3]
MQHYFINSNLPDDHNIELPTDVAKHFVRVLRSEPGDQLEVVLNDHHVYLAELTKIDGQQAVCHIIRDLNHNVELPVKISLICGLPKQSKPEIIVQKSTELGVNEIIFTQMQRSVVHWDNKADKKISRLQEVAKSAAEQSHRNVVPKIKFAKQIADIDMDDYDVHVVAYEESAKQGEQSNLSKAFSNMNSGDSAVFVIGPEGGVSDDEINHLSESQFISAGLGPRILRTETAPFYVLAAASYHFELSH